MDNSKYLWRFLPPILWMVVIFLFSSRPDLPKNEIFVVDFIFKKSAHIIEYFVLVLLWNKALRTNSLPNAILISLFYAFTDEVHQLFVPGRGALLRDVGIDFIGITLATLYISRKKYGKTLHLDIS